THARETSIARGAAQPDEAHRVQSAGGETFFDPGFERRRNRICSRVPASRAHGRMLSSGRASTMCSMRLLYLVLAASLPMFASAEDHYVCKAAPGGGWACTAGGEPMVPRGETNTSASPETPAPTSSAQTPTSTDAAPPASPSEGTLP